MSTEPIELLYARLDERLKTIEREVGRIAGRAPQWPSIVAAAAACTAVVITLIDKI